MNSGNTQSAEGVVNNYPGNPGYYAYPAPMSVPYASPVKQPSGWGKLWAGLSLAFAVMIVQVFGILLGLLSRTDNGMLTVGELVGGITALLFVVALGGKKLVVPSWEGMRETWHIIKWIFIVDAIIAVVDTITIIVDGSFELATLWPLRVITLLLMCIGIGLFEEATFRGLVFHGLLARMGTNKKGVFWAVIISSIVFGLMHIDPTSMQWSDPSQLAQAVLKIAQTGIFGFAAAAAVLKTQRLWPVVIFHGLNDFILMLVSNGLMSTPVTTEYVTEGTDGLYAIGIYLVLCAAYIPSIIASLKVLREHTTPDRGQFYRVHTYPPQYAPMQTAAYYPAQFVPTQAATYYPTQTAPMYSASMQTTPLYTAPAQTMPAYAAPVQPGPTQVVPTQSMPTYVSQMQGVPTQIVATYTAPAQATPPQNEPTQASPAPYPYIQQPQTQEPLS